MEAFDYPDASDVEPEPSISPEPARPDEIRLAVSPESIEGLYRGLSGVLNGTLGRGDPTAWTMTDWEIKAVSAAWSRIAARNDAVEKILANADIATVVVIHGAHLARNLIKEKNDKRTNIESDRNDRGEDPLFLHVDPDGGSDSIEYNGGGDYVPNYRR